MLPGTTQQTPQTFSIRISSSSSNNSGVSVDLGYRQAQ